MTEEIIDEPDEVDEQTAELTSGPIVDYSSSSSAVQGGGGDFPPTSPGVVITEITDSYTPRGGATPMPEDIPDIPQEVEEAVRESLESSVGPILSR